MVLNIVGNAIKFTSTGGVVDVRVARSESRAAIVIRDTGVGISPTLLPHVFDRFRQGKSEAGRQRGVGLGLWIARALVELHGGTIQLDSDGEGQGTTCTIDLPMASPAVQARPSARL